MRTGEHVLVTGDAGYIGSLLTAELLRSGCLVRVVDNRLYGGDSRLGFIAHPDLHFFKADIYEPGAIRLALRHDWPRPTAVIHLAALAGFLACRYNFARSFVHIQDRIGGYLLALGALSEKIRDQVYNLGCESGNYTKDGIVKLVLQHPYGRRYRNADKLVH